MLRNMKKYKNGIESEGFTIIEVMIVLAIAGLILLTVFLAVPALQRSNRNTDRAKDAGDISTSVQSFISNNNSDIPGWGTTTPTAAASTTPASQWNKDCLSIAGDIGSSLSVLKDSISSSTCEKDGGTGETGVTELSGSTFGPTVTASIPQGFYEVGAEYTLPNATGDQKNDAVIYDTYAVCSGNTPAASNSSTTATANNSVLVYTYESGNSSYTWKCLQIQ